MNQSAQQWLAALLLFWLLLFVVDYYLKISRKFIALYKTVVLDNGITVHLFRLQWYTRSFNALLIRLGQIKPQLLDRWFDTGVVCTLITTALSTAFLVMIPINTLARSQTAEQQILKPVIPGVNLPNADIGFYLFTLFLSTILHELGHAVAAVRENVKLNGFGLFLLFLYPGAFVDMNTESLLSVSPWKQLKIFCAGVWHNLVIVLVGFCMLLSLPVLLIPLYTLREELVVVSHKAESILTGASGFVPGDIITSVDSCPVSSASQWRECLVHSLEPSYQATYCIPWVTFQSAGAPHTSTDAVCECQEESNQLCFTPATDDTLLNGVKCLVARQVVSHGPCSSGCDKSLSVCIRPYTKHLDNSTRLLAVSRKFQKAVLFFGHPADLHHSLVVGEVIPKSSFAPLGLPYFLESLCKYFMSLSGALAILNVIPCYTLDGQHIARALINWAMPSSHAHTKDTLMFTVTLGGTFLLMVNLVLAMYTFLM